MSGSEHGWPDEYPSASIPPRFRNGLPPDYAPAPVNVSKAIADRAFRKGAMIFGAVGFIAGWLLT